MSPIGLLLEAGARALSPAHPVPRGLGLFVPKDEFLAKPKTSVCSRA
jgi:hypothetical protein